MRGLQSTNPLNHDLHIINHSQAYSTAQAFTFNLAPGAPALTTAVSLPVFFAVFVVPTRHGVGGALLQDMFYAAVEIR